MVFLVIREDCLEICPQKSEINHKRFISSSLRNTINNQKSTKKIHWDLLASVKVHHTKHVNSKTQTC